jgi:hypothetical protein
MRTLAIGVLALTLVSGESAAQTPAEQAAILRDFQQSVLEYTQRDSCLDAFHAFSAPRIFTPPVAMVFRQMIVRALAERDGVAVVNGMSVNPHPAVLEPFPSQRLDEFPRVLLDTLPPLPTPLEYRLIGNDLVVRDRDRDIIAGVVRDALGSRLTVVR